MTQCKGMILQEHDSPVRRLLGISVSNPSFVTRFSKPDPNSALACDVERDVRQPPEPKGAIEEESGGSPGSQRFALRVERWAVSAFAVVGAIAVGRLLAAATVALFKAGVVFLANPV
jgi:hypothetical protein